MEERPNMDNFTTITIRVPTATMTKAQLQSKIAELIKERDTARREVCEFRLGDRHEVEAWRRGWDCYEHRNLVGKGKA